MIFVMCEKCSIDTRGWFFFFAPLWVWVSLPLLIWTCFTVFDLLMWVGVQRKTWSGWHQYLGWLSVFLLPSPLPPFYLFKAEVFPSVNRHTEVSVAQLVVISWIYRWNDRIPWAYPHSLFHYLSNTLSFLPRRHKQKDLRGNLCRNPDNSTTGPWCFTKNPSIRYQNCNIPQCSQGKRWYISVIYTHWVLDCWAAFWCHFENGSLR